jgi:hypothetical protein
MGHPVRTVAMRDGLMMRGNHHMPAGRRHWRADASSFRLVDEFGTALLWVDGNEVVGDIGMTVAKPQFDRGNGLPVIPNANETLLSFALVQQGGLPMIRTWWAVGKNVDRTMRKARLELFNPKTWPERSLQLLQMMKWVN